MKIYRYPPRALAGDYLRATIGLAVGLGILFSVPPSTWILVIFGAWSALFGAFAYKTVQRHLTRVAVTDTEICNAAFATRVMAWDELRRLKLRFFGTRRQARGQGGFMQLTLKGDNTSLTYDSALEGFDYIAWRAARALRHNGISTDPTSAGNLLSLGVDADEDSPPPEAPERQERPE